jgi:mycoredoxin
MLGTSYAPFGYAPAAVAEVVVYGSRWCGVTMMVRRHLDRAGVPYRFVDWDAHPEVRGQLEWLAGGRLASPTVTVGGQVLVQPSLRELDWALSRAGYR